MTVREHCELIYATAERVRDALRDPKLCVGDDVGSAAARDVIAERRRQVEAEGWTPEHDDEHDDGELALAAACYAGHPGMIPSDRRDRPPLMWPWHPAWWRPSDRRRDLVRAGALILAEIERLDRASATAGVNVGSAEGSAAPAD